MNCSMPGLPVLHYRRPLNSTPSTVSCLLGHECARQMTGSDGGERSRYLFRQPLPVSVLLVLQFSSVAQSCLTLCDPMGCSTPGFPVHYQLPELTQTHVHRVSDAIKPSHPLLTLLLPPSIFPNIRVFSKESVLCIRWPKYWSFSFSPSNEYSGLISFTGPWVPIKIL